MAHEEQGERIQAEGTATEKTLRTEMGRWGTVHKTAREQVRRKGGGQTWGAPQARAEVRFF